MGPDTSAMWFSGLIAREIKRLGSQAELARRVDVSQQTVSNWKNGGMPRPAEAARLAGVIGWDSVAFIEELWPDVREHDRLQHLRQLLARATDRQIETVTDFAASYMSGEPSVTTEAAE